MLSSQACINHENSEALIASLVLERFPKEMQDLLSNIMLAPVETVSEQEAMEVEGTTPEVVMEAEGANPEVETVKV